MVKGILQEISPVVKLKDGVGKNNKPWVLWGCHLKVSGQDYGLTGFSKQEIDGKIANLYLDGQVEFEAEDTGKYLNVAKDAVILTTPSLGVAKKYGDLPEIKLQVISDDKEIEEAWESSFKFVTSVLKENKIIVEGFEQIGPSINTLFMKKMEERRRR